MDGISVAIITYNEERNLADCIRSCEEVADEIVVLDSFSTDRTEEIARSFPKVRFSQHPFDGHVQQKNRALALCRNEWVLSLDADERVTPELAAEIQTTLGSTPRHAGFQIPRVTFHLGRWRTAWRILLPAASPLIATGLRVSSGIALILAVTAELVAGQSGLGSFILQAQLAIRVAEMYAGILTVAVLGFGLNLLLGAVEGRMLAWHRGATAKETA